VVAAGMVDSYRMPAYRDQLSDEQIADVVSFIRSNWGNQGDKAKAAEVKACAARHRRPAPSRSCCRYSDPPMIAATPRSILTQALAWLREGVAWCWPR
jgi:hypothetical protein